MKKISSNNFNKYFSEQQVAFREYLEKFLQSFPICYFATTSYGFLKSYKGACRDINLIQRNFALNNKSQVFYIGVYKMRFYVKSTHCHILLGIKDDKKIDVDFDKLYNDLPAIDIKFNRVRGSGQNLCQYISKRNHMQDLTDKSFDIICSNPKRLAKYLRKKGVMF